jgi:hypothetical protein
LPLTVIGVTDHSPPELELVELLDELLEELLDVELLDELDELLEPPEELDEPPPQATRAVAARPRMKALTIDAVLNRGAADVHRYEWSIIKPHYYMNAERALSYS